MESIPKSVKIHFAWTEHCLKMRKQLRQQLIGASEPERIDIIKNYSVYNTFLLKRGRNFTFANLVYFNILNDRKVLNQILPRIYAILSKYFIPDSEFSKLKSSGVPRAYPSLNIESMNAVLKKFSLTNRDTIRYLSEREKSALNSGDLDMAISARSLLKEYIPPGTFTLNDLFTDQLLVKQSIHPLKYDKIYNKYDLEVIHNFSLYNLPLNPLLFYFSLELKDKIAEDLTNKMIRFVCDNLELQPDINILIEYLPLFNHVLSIASSIYFYELSLEKKLDLINKDLTVEKFINFLEGFDIKGHAEVWRNAATRFNINGAPFFALKIMELLESKWLFSVKQDDQYQFFDTMATIHRNLGNYEKSLHYYEKAWNCIEYSKTYAIRIPTSITDLIQEKAIQNSLQYRQGICYKNIGESHGHLGNQKKKEEYFQKAIEIASSKIDVPEKFSLYGNLAVACRRLHDFEKERDFLNKALDYMDDTIHDDEIAKLESRIKEFDDSSMKKDVLLRLEFEKSINLALLNAKKLQNSFFFTDSITFYLKALNLIDEKDIKRDRSEILMEIGFSYMYLKEWNKSREFFLKSLTQKQLFEVNMYMVLVQIKLNNIQEARKYFIKIENAFNDPPDIIRSKDYTWIIDILNNMDDDELSGFISFSELLSNPIQKFNFVSVFGNVSASNGLSDFAIELFEQAIKYSPENHRDFIAANLNNIGTIHVEEDRYDDGIKFFKQGIQADKDCYLCLKNMVNAYVQKLEFEEAQKNQESLLILLKRLDAPQEIITSNENILSLIKKFLEDVININKFDIQEVKGFLLTAESFFLDYRGRSPPFDASPIVIEFAKALERILHDKISPSFKDLINKYRKEEWSRDFKFKFGMWFKGKSINLGTWARIFEDFEKKKDIELDLQEFKEYLFSKFDKSNRKIISSACSDLSIERNPLSHYKSLSMDEVFVLRRKLIKHLNLVSGILF